MTKGDALAKVRAPVTVGQLAGLMALLLGVWTLTDRACPVAQAPAAIERQRVWAVEEFDRVRAESGKAIEVERRTREQQLAAVDKKLDKIQEGVDYLVKLHVRP